MPRPAGPYSEGKSRPLAVRVPDDLYQAILEAAGVPIVDGEPDEDAFKQRFPEWARGVFRAATGKGFKTLSGAQLQGYEEGKRQGWARANAAFREALGVAAAKLK
jgi:hypothetical protein